MRPTSCWFMTHLRVLKSCAKTSPPVCSSMIPILENRLSPPQVAGQRRSLWDLQLPWDLDECLQ